MAIDAADTKHKLYEHVRAGAEEAGVFADVKVGADGVRCEADGSAEPAFYRVYVEEGDVWVSLETEDRWLSGSIEAISSARATSSTSFSRKKSLILGTTTRLSSSSTSARLTRCTCSVPSSLPH